MINEEKDLTRMINNLDGCEGNVLECKKEFERIIDSALDAYNANEISKIMMKDMIKISQKQIEEAEITLVEIKGLRESLVKQRESL